MKTTFYNFRKVCFLFLFVVIGMQFGMAQIDADISMVSVSPATGPYYYGQKITYTFRVTNNSIAPYDITRVVLRDQLPDGLEFQQADNSLTYVDVGGGVWEASSNDFIPSGGGTMNYSIVLTVIGCNGGTNAWQNKIELYQFFNGISELSLNDPDNHTNNDTDFVTYRFDIFDLALKSVTGNIYPNYGATVAFDITVYNQGSIPAYNVKIANYTLPGYTLNPASNPSWTFDPVTGNYKHTFTSPLAAGASRTVSVLLTLNAVQNQNQWANYAEIVSANDIAGTPMADVDGVFDEDYTNDAGGKPGSAADDAIDGDGTGVIQGTNPLTDEDNHDPGYAKIFDLALKKHTDQTSLLSYGNLFKFYFTVYNQGTVPVRNVKITDYLPSGYTYSAADNTGLGWTVAGSNLENTIPLMLQPGANTTIEVNLRIVDVVSDHTAYVNFAEISAAQDEFSVALLPADDADSEMNSNTVNERNEKPASVNDDNIWSTGAGGFQDDFDPGMAYFNDLALRKTVLTTGPYHAGDEIKFSVKIYNQGGIAVRDIDLLDYIPDGYEFALTSFPAWQHDSNNNQASARIDDVLLPGDSIEEFIYLRILPVNNKFESYVNFTEITGAKDRNFNILLTDIDSRMDINPGNDAGGLYRSANDNYVLGNGTGTPLSPLAATDEDDSDPALPDVFDMAIRNTLLTAGPYTYGQDLTFRFEVFNQGNMPVNNIRIADYIPAGYTVVSAPGWTILPNMITNLNTNTLNPGQSYTLDVVFKIKMTNGGEKDWIHYAEVTNIYRADNGDVSGWDLDSDLGSNSPSELSVEIGSANDDQIWVRGPYMSEDEDDHDPAGIELFDLALQNIVNALYYPFDYGDIIPFKITVFNQGSIAAKNIKITDKIPCGFQFTLANNPGWVQNALNQTVEYTLPQTLAPGASVDVLLYLNVKDCLTSGDSWINLAEISSAQDFNGNLMNSNDFDSTFDANFTNDPGGTPDTSEDNQLDGDGKNGPANGYVREEDDSDPARIYVFDLAMTKTLVNPNPKYGDILTFNLTIYNQGNQVATNIDLKDYEPTGFEFDPVINPGWTGTIFTGLNYTFTGTLNPKTSVVVPLKLRMVGTDGGSTHWLNYAEIADADNASNPDFIYLDPDSNPNSNTPIERSVKLGDPDDNNITSTDKGGYEDDHDPAGVKVNDLAIKKEIVTPGPYKHGDLVEYRITVYNQGNQLAREIQLVDYKPAGINYSPVNFPLWHADAFTGNSHATLSAALQPGASIEVPLYSVVQLVDKKCENAYTNNVEIFEFRDKDFYVVPLDFDSKPDYISTNDVGGTPNTPEDNHIYDDRYDYNGDGIYDEDDSDPAKLEIIDVALKAELMTPAPHFYGQNQQFRIRVYNQGNEPIRNTQIKYYIPAGYEIDYAANPGWSSTDASYTIANQINPCDSFDIFVTLKMKMTNGGEKDWINYFEVIHVLNHLMQDRTGWDMDSDPGSDTAQERSVELGDANDNNIWVRGSGFGQDQDDHDPAGLEIYDLALTKSFNNTYPHYYGDVINFEIKIFNQGSIAVKDILVTDYVPAGYIFDASINAGWTFDPATRFATTTLSSNLVPGASTTRLINLKLTDSYNAGDDWENGAEISAFKDLQGNVRTGQDFDSTNDQIRNNDPGLDEPDFVGGDGKNGPAHGYPRVEDDADLAIVPVFDLALKKTVVTPGPYAYGNNITFKIDVFNQGNEPAQSIVIKDFIAMGYTFNPALNPGWTPGSGIATYNLPGVLNPDNSASVNLVLTLERTDGGYDNWINYATIQSAGNPDGIHTVDADSYPNTDAVHERDVKPGSAYDDVVNQQYINFSEDEDDHDPAGIKIFDLAMRKTLNTTGPTYDYGQTIDFKVEIFNQGNLDAKDIIIEEEAIPCGFQFDIAANPGWNYNAVTKSATYTYTGTLVPGAVAELIVKMIVWDCHNPDYQNSWKNNIEITSAKDGSGNTYTSDIDSQYDNNPNNDLVVDDAIQLPTNQDDDDHDITIASIPDLALKIAADSRGPFAPGQVATFTITVYNQGNMSLKSIKLYDYISPGYAFISGATNPGWSLANPTTAQYTFSGPLVPRDSFKVKIKLTVQMATQVIHWTHYAEVAQAITLNDLILTDDADGIFASNTAYERAVVVGHPWDDKVKGIGYNRTPFEDMDDHDPASVDVVGKVGDFVWDDKNGNGIQDTGEPGIPGVTVKLIHCNPASGIGTQTTVTDANGKYLFNMVIPGQYYVKFELPSPWQFTLANQGPNDLKDSDVDGDNGYGTTECFQVDANEEQLDIDAGAYKCVEIGDLVWLDNNKDNKYTTGETGVNGLRVELYRLTNGSWVFWDFDYTGINPNSICGDGYYHFCTNPGTYYLKFVTPPTGLVPAQPNVGGNDNIDSDITRAFGPGTTDQFVLVSGASGNFTIDAGYYGMAQISASRAWIDNNTNGLQETNEPGLANTEVEIYDALGDLYSTTITDASGNYDLTYLQAENYFVKFRIPAPYSSTYGFTSSDQGDEQIDSDVTHANGFGTTDMFYLNPDDNSQHVDAGIAAGTLPLNFINIGAKWYYDQTNVYWSTANEKNVDKFIVQRSYQNTNKFENIGEVDARNEGNNSYHFSDKDDFKEGIYYYRVLQVDNDGMSTKSNTVAVFVDKNNDTGKYSVYPNPVSSDANVSLVLTENSDIRIDLLDLTGKMVIANIANESLSSGIQEFKFNVSNLRPATYMLKIQDGDKIEFMEVIVIKK
ncbi:MAG: SdrD B-like domain-containing protein [Deltaproteobacteria bacterium]